MNPLPISKHRTNPSVSMPLKGVTRQMLHDRTREMAVQAGRRPLQITQGDYERARVELTGESDTEPQEAVLDAIPKPPAQVIEVAAWENEGGSLRSARTPEWSPPSWQTLSPSRLHPFLSNYHRVTPFTPSLQAVTGALSIFVEGCLREDVRQQLFGLSVLSSATAEQVHAAIPAVEVIHGVMRKTILSLFVRE